LIWFLKKPHLPRAIARNWEREQKWVKNIIWRYFISFFIVAICGTSSNIPTYLKYATSVSNGQHTLSLSLLLSFSAFVHNSIWALSLVNLWLVHHLVARDWRNYIQKLSKGGFHSIAQALLEHANLTEQLSQVNGSFEIFMFASLSLVLPLIIASLYVSLLPNYFGFSGWTLGFLFDVFYLFCIVVPGSVVTTRTRRVIKITNKMRALMDPNDEKAIRQIDSFLCYLTTNNASSKVAGVAIDLGFITKLCISMFTLCAFVVQRELSGTKVN